MESHPELLIERRGALGILTLNRPQANNVLSLRLIQELATGVADFAQDPAVGAVMIAAKGSVFSAGGDVIGILAHPPGPEFERYRREYFTAEYNLNYRIHTCPKPYVAVIDGLTMGGGCGVSLHGSHVVATERALIAMPETAIGHFPDVGATWFLNRLPGEMGCYVGLRGLRLTAPDAMALGLTTHFLGSERVPGLIGSLAAAPRLDHATVDAVLQRLGSEPASSPLTARLARVDALFAGDTVEAIIEALETATESWAKVAVETLRRASPRSLKVTLKMLRDGRSLTVAEALRIEYRICVRVTGSPDFREGVRAALIDKDGAPRWQPERLEALDDDAVAAYFSPLAPTEPELDLPGC